MGPKKLPLKFLGSHVRPSVVKVIGSSLIIELGKKPFLRAVAYTIGLNADPGWRRAWVARSNWLVKKFMPPTMALTDPVFVLVVRVSGPPLCDTLTDFVRGESLKL